MSLIICKKCGRRVSNTANNCIHCGASLKEEISNKLEMISTVEEHTEKENIEGLENIIYSGHRISFNQFSDDDRFALEREFLFKDKWARKYRSIKEELNAFFYAWTYVLLTIISALMILGLNRFFDNLLLINPSMAVLSTTSFILLGVLLLGMLIYSMVMKIIFKVSLAKYIYMKKFQKWLKEEKAIEYKPALLTIKDKEIFDSLDLNNLNI